MIRLVHVQSKRVHTLGILLILFPKLTHTFRVIFYYYYEKLITQHKIHCQILIIKMIPFVNNNYIECLKKMCDYSPDFFF